MQNAYKLCKQHTRHWSSFVYGCLVYVCCSISACACVRVKVLEVLQVCECAGCVLKNFKCSQLRQTSSCCSESWAI